MQKNSFFNTLNSAQLGQIFIQNAKPANQFCAIKPMFKKEIKKFKIFFLWVFSCQ